MSRSHVPVAGLESRCGQLGGLLATAGPRLVVRLVARLRLRRPGWHRLAGYLGPATCCQHHRSPQHSSAQQPRQLEAGPRLVAEHL